MNTMPPGQEAPDLASLAPAALIEAARRETGLADFGAPDVHEPLRELHASMAKEARLSPNGILGMRMTLTRLLVNRLRIQAELKAHPEILDEELRGPIVIVGLPRTGTTKMQRMIAADPRLQKLLLWRIFNPVPFGPARPGQPDPRIAYARMAEEQMRSAWPSFHAAHPMGAEAPDEEDFLMELSLANTTIFHYLRVRGYEDWVETRDNRVWYRQLRQLIQYMQWQDGGAGRMWLLKAPTHMGRIHYLFEAFPAATVVHCHRDIATAVGSTASLVKAARAMYSDHVDDAMDGRFALSYWRLKMGQYLQQRAALEERHRFVDIYFDDIVRDPFPAIEEIYRAVGLELTAPARAAMAAWQRDNPQHKHGEHRYRLEDFGLSREGIYEEFSAYIKRFPRGGPG